MRICTAVCVGSMLFVLPGCQTEGESESLAPSFLRAQSDVFEAPGGQPNAWADYDNDGDLDLFIGFRGAPDRLYRNDRGVLTDVASDVGLADPAETRAAAWGDFDGDGHLDLFIGYPATANRPNRLYRNEGNGVSFTEVAESFGLVMTGTTRQPVWVDYDQDGDVDLFVAFRDKENRLFRNDGTRFTDVSSSAGIADPRRTVGVVWFDMDTDGDLDLYVANQNGDSDAFFKNEDGHFTDVASALGMDWPDRGAEYGSVGPAVTDYDNDGDLDLFIATYGPDVLWQNQGDGTFVNVAPGTLLSNDHHSTTASWGDFDNDGFPDLFVASYMSNVPEDPDHLFRNENGRFKNVTPDVIIDRGASHGVTWADFDGDGDLDLSLANNNLESGHPLYINQLSPDVAGRSLQVVVLDSEGRWTLPGAEVRLFHDGMLLGSRLVDTGGGYCSQGAVPVHFGLPAGVDRVRVEVTTFQSGERVIVTRENIVPGNYAGRWLEIRVGAN